MTPLRQRMTNDMTVRGLAENTKRSYLTSVTGLARHYRRSPDQISAQDRSFPGRFPCACLIPVQGVRDRLFIRLSIGGGLETGHIVFGTRKWLHDVWCRHRCAKL